MGRKKNEIEAVREQVEGDLALLGSARVYLTLISDRLNATSRLDVYNILSPALEDVVAADELIRRVQSRIQGREQKP